MTRLALALLLFAAACSASEVSRIVGGTPTTIEKYPSMVQVENLYFDSIWSQRCAGNILTRRFVLTSAICVDRPWSSPQNRRIRAGATDRNAGGVVVGIGLIHIHPTFGQNGYDGDIAVVALLTPLDYSDKIAQASIIAQNTVIPDNLPVVLAGWGRTSFFGGRAEQLAEVRVLTVNNAECATRHQNWPNPPVVTSNMICGGLLDVSAEGSCFGDGGGPMFYGDIVIGVISWRKYCGNGTYPGISTSVASYTDWIVATAV